MELTTRGKYLVDRGYNKDDVIRLTNYNTEDLNYVLEVIFYRLTKGLEKTSNPTAIFIGGQPGAGKSSEVIRMKEEYSNIVEIIIDHYRAYHPHYLEIEELIRKHWTFKTITLEDSPGNDLADFTTDFVGVLTDKLIELSSIKDKFGKSYNLLIEWGMRTPESPLETMKMLKEKGYTNIVKFICIHKSISLKACSIRSKIINDDKHIIRNVPINFHNMCIETLPSSINTIYQIGFDNNYIDKMNLILRDGTIIWDNNSNILPGIVFKNYLEDYELTKSFSNSTKLAEENTIKELEILRKL